MKYSELASVYNKLSQTTKRLEKTGIIAEFLKSLPEEDLDATILLLQGRVFARWDKRTLGVSSKLAVKAVAKTAGVNEGQIQTLWRKKGDLGLVTEEILKQHQQATLFSQELTIKEVFTKLQSLESIEGTGSVGKKLSIIQSLLSSAESTSVKYLLGTILEELRVGVAEGVIRDAIVWAYLNPPIEGDQVTDREVYNTLVEKVQGAYDRCSDFAKVARAAKTNELEKITFILGQPIRVMLAQRETSVSSALERVGPKAAFEYKYDGFRLQIHKDGESVRLFTRRLEEVTAQFPEVVTAVKKHIKAEKVLFDAEAVGFEAFTGKYLPFQSISQRIRRKYDIEALAEKFPVELCIFDILYLEDKEVLNEPFEERRELLRSILPEDQEKQVRLSKILITKDAKEGDSFYKAALESGNEGLMAKNLKGVYKPGSRVGHMVKIKPTMDTLDLVIIAAEWGEGKRSGWFTSFTLACADSSSDTFLSVGKVGTGLKELDSDDAITFEKLTNLLKNDVLEESGREVTLHPRIVIEIKFEEIQKSPSYEAGYALRFPRVVNLREDRGPEDISTIDEVEAAFRLQRT